MTTFTMEAANNLALKIFHSQEINQAFVDIFDFFLANNFPLDFFNIPILDDKRAVARYRVVVTREQVILVDETVKLSNDAFLEAGRLRKEKIILINNTEESAICQAAAAHLGISETFSTIALNTKIKQHQYAIIGLVALGKDRYLADHYQRLEEMYDAISSIVQHMLNQIEMVDIQTSLVIENKELRKRLGFLDNSLIIGMESGLSEVLEQIEQVAPLDSPVLLIGETGVGKEVLATAIHQKSSRADKPFVSLNCGAIPETLLETELFGHEKGAFTGAERLSKGYFEQADGGTIFLDEIGELSLNAQVKLLRLIQTLEFKRVGGQVSMSVDVRIVAATNRDLKGMVRELKFRKDLWYRLNVFPILIPPLKDRKEDIPALAEYFMRHKSKEMNISYTPHFAPKALAQLQSYDWPGNVRELQNVIERAIIISRGQPISFPHLSELNPDIDLVASSATDTTRFPTMNEMIIRHIVKSLELSNWKIEGTGGAAELLNMHPSTLRSRMRKLGIRFHTSRKLSIGS